MTEPRNLLEIEKLRLSVTSRAKETIPILLDVSLTVAERQVVAVVGESGSGKSMTTRTVLRLLPDGAKTDGDVRFEGRDVLAMSSSELAKFRSSKIGMIYQDPRAHINPLWTIGDFLLEGVSGREQRRAARAKALRLLTEVGVRDGERRLQQYPHQLSGGLLQRMMIVMALMPDPELIIADEATTALDVTVQAGVMKVFKDLKEQRGLAMLFITHDLDLAASVADTIVVMYAGRVVERGSAEDVYERPAHPYTEALLKSRPNPRSRERLVSIPGRPASAATAGGGCAFAPRCRFATEICTSEVPQLRVVDRNAVACHHAEAIRVPEAKVVIA